MGLIKRACLLRPAYTKYNGMSITFKTSTTRSFSVLKRSTADVFSQFHDYSSHFKGIDKIIFSSDSNFHALVIRAISTTMQQKQVSDNTKEKSGYSYGVSSDMMEGAQGLCSWPENHKIEGLSKLENPCPQGIQGDDCDKFKLWLSNCTKYNFINCESQFHDLKEGRKTLGQIFEEQEHEIKLYAQDNQNKASNEQVGINSSSKFSNLKQDDKIGESADVKVSQKDRLKKAVSQYGSTVVVFHVGISLMSLGGFYVAVSSGLDVVSLLQKMGVGQSILESRLAAGASTFVVAYAVHKVFAPVRIATTLTCTPFIVKYLRRKGILKPPKHVKAS